MPSASLSGDGVPGITLDESAIGTDTADGVTPNGLATDTVDFSGAFGTAEYGADGDHSYELQLTGSSVGSGLYALDPDRYEPDGGLGKGAEIMLVDNGDGTISGMVGTTEYFLISVDSDMGEVTFTQEANIWHPDTGNNDDAQSIVPDGGTLSLVQTFSTDADGDANSASFDLSGAFTIQDDGPTAVLDTNTVTEGDTLTVLAVDGVLSNDDFGTDGKGTIVGVEHSTDTSSPVSGDVGTQIDGDYGKLTPTTPMAAMNMLTPTAKFRRPAPPTRSSTPSSTPTATARLSR